MFETIRVVGGRPLAWQRHIERLARSARWLKYRLELSSDSILDSLRRALDANGLADAVARITITRGRNLRGLDLRDCVDPHLLITVRPYDPPTAEQLRRGIRLHAVRVPDREGWLRYRTKSGNYLDMILALDTAMRAGADEALLVDRRGRILEGARTNIFVVMSDGIATPPVRLGILPGIMRALALGWARREGIPAAVRSVTYRSMRRAREAFVTNCVWGIMPVRSVDEHPLGTRVPGPITRRLMERHDRWAQRGT